MGNTVVVINVYSITVVSIFKSLWFRFLIIWQTIFLAERICFPNWDPVLHPSVHNRSCHNYIKGNNNRGVKVRFILRLGTWRHLLMKCSLGAFCLSAWSTFWWMKFMQACTFWKSVVQLVLCLGPSLLSSYKLWQWMWHVNAITCPGKIANGGGGNSLTTML